jgi:hypothetical protein
MDVILPLGSLSQMQLLFHNQGNEPNKDFTNRGTYAVMLIISVFVCMRVCAGEATHIVRCDRSDSNKLLDNFLYRQLNYGFEYTCAVDKISFSNIRSN